MWDLETLRQYISWVQQIRPVMTPEAEEILRRYYQVQRQSSCRDAARTTVRMFESLIRIAQVCLKSVQWVQGVMSHSVSRR